MLRLEIRFIQVILLVKALEPCAQYKSSPAIKSAFHDMPLFLLL